MLPPTGPALRVSAASSHAVKTATGKLGAVFHCRTVVDMAGAATFAASWDIQVSMLVRCAAGLWMWSSPVDRRGPDGSKYSLVLLDTEGIDAYDQARTGGQQRCNRPALALNSNASATHHCRQG